ncbi:uroporphyrinogen decarboxylase family protein [Aminobacterium colombiense]|jgi:uroporphyrinogen decarboxylase|uniref:Uroporphyrinogen decarboxylase n=1 Tax=Aminobacterium colombiense (strain DSM 12261 / ALA-1) TaxID=572547 RepID=D5EDG5_AMICL|nr:uroporphyrinogen decarboxylase family protein [Aminobacterium colombiense]ADE56597.1 uroporphyrinogen decarboxylase [Aminobacterium colombiense DSM 12261]
MKPIKRIEALLEGKRLETPAINLWKHFPPYDEDPKMLIKKTIQFQERFHWDFVKVTYQGLFSIQDWGSKIKWPTRDCEWPNTCAGVGVVTDYSIKNVEDWKKLHVLPMDEGSMKDTIDVAKGVIDHYKGEAPVVVTVFNSLTTAQKMSGDKMFIHMRQNPEAFREGIETITQTTINYVKELVNAGADGIFFASQLGNYDKMSVAEYETFGRPYDLSILEHAKKMWFNIMHMHGNAPMFEMMSQYPVQALNWHDRLVDIDLRKGRELCGDKILIGGVDEFTVLPNGSDDELKAQLLDALQQVSDGRIILGPGCCVPSSINEDRFELAKKLLLEL